MINFKKLQREKETLREQFLAAQPFPHITIEPLANSNKTHKLS